VLFVAFGLQYAVTISVAAQGELINEKAGILNIGIEGVLIISSFVAAASNTMLEPSLGKNAPIVALMAAMGAGVLVNFIFAVLSTKLYVDQVIAGIGINIFALGITYIVLKTSFTIDGTPIGYILPPLVTLQGLASNLAIRISPLVLAMFVIPFLSFLFLSRTKLGLHIRAVGENPKAAEVAGVSVQKTRILATSLGGALLGMAGGYLTVDLFNQFTPGITGGLGFIALAAVIAGAWNPFYVLGVAGVFGASEGLRYVIGATSGPQAYILSMPPYLVTIAIMAIASRRLRPPAALAQPYKKE
jgi:general nucleoside transport system permease protein